MARGFVLSKVEVWGSFSALYSRDRDFMLNTASPLDRPQGRLAQKFHSLVLAFISLLFAISWLMPTLCLF